MLQGPHGGVPERPNGAVLKTAEPSRGSLGSNPSPAAQRSWFCEAFCLLIKRREGVCQIDVRRTGERGRCRFVASSVVTSSHIQAGLGCTGGAGLGACSVIGAPASLRERETS